MVQPFRQGTRSDPPRRFSRTPADDDAESRNENGDRRRPKALLQMAEKPVEIDGVFWRLVHQARQQIGDVNLPLHARNPTCLWAIIEEPPNSAARQDIPARRRAGHRVPWRPRPRHSPCCRLP